MAEITINTTSQVVAVANVERRTLGVHNLSASVPVYYNVDGSDNSPVTGGFPLVPGGTVIFSGIDAGRKLRMGVASGSAVVRYQEAN